MSTIKSFSVGCGDMFYIDHNSDNFSIIDCYLTEANRKLIVDELRSIEAGKGVTRFISTHPDEDHLLGLQYLDEKLGLQNFYCTKNNATKDDASDDFEHYCTLRDSDKAFHIYRGCARRWMNKTNDERDSAGIDIVWPVVDNEHYQSALAAAADGYSPNNMSAVIKYSLRDGATFLWMGDLETDFMDKIADAIAWPKVDVIFAAHHGRRSGRIPHALLDQLKPRLIVLGEAPSRHLHYYGGYQTLTQNSAGDLTFQCVGSKVHIFSSEVGYRVAFLDDECVSGSDHYVGTLNLS